jgi:hypothetical protein
MKRNERIIATANGTRAVGSLVAAFALIAQPILPAGAKPPTNANGRYKEFFENLFIPYKALGTQNKVLCCSLRDCRVVKAEPRDGERQLDGKQHWWAYISTEVFGEESQAPNAWMEVRDEAIVDDKDLPPNGPLEPIVCWAGAMLGPPNYQDPYDAVLCFVKPRIAAELFPKDRPTYGLNGAH